MPDIVAKDFPSQLRIGYVVRGEGGYSCVIRPELFLGETADNLTAARILLPDVQNAIVQALGAQFHADIPCRDWFVCGSREQSHDWKARNIADARSSFLDDDHRLTPDVFPVSAGAFSVFLDQSSA